MADQHKVGRTSDLGTCKFADPSTPKPDDSVAALLVYDVRYSTLSQLLGFCTFSASKMPLRSVEDT